MSDEWLQFEHAKLGRLRLQRADLLEFDGIPGFPSARRFTLVEHDEGGRFAWLACCDDLELAFPVIPLADVCPEQWQALGPDQLSAVGASRLDEVEAFAIVNMCRVPAEANIEAPLLIHTGTRHGAQIFLPVPEPSAG